MTKTRQKPNNLLKLRKQINVIDEKILKLISSRAKVVDKVGEWKRKNRVPVYDPQREISHLSELENSNKGPLPKSSVHTIFSTIIQECRLYEEKNLAINIKNKSKNKVSVIGLGLMGGSLAKALRNHGEYKVYGFDRKGKKGLSKYRLVDQFTETETEACRADILILALPIRESIKFLIRNSDAIRPGTLVLDLGSTKSEICESAIRHLATGVHFVGGHPIAGKHVSGCENADPALFKGRYFVLCSTRSSTSNHSAIELAKKLVLAVDGVPILMSPKDHDRILAVTSHLPQLLSVSLALTARSLLKRDLVVSGLSFLEMTRRAAGNTQMWNDVIHTNQSNILKSIREFRKILSEIESSK